MSGRLWEGGQLLDIHVLRCDCDAPIVKTQNAMMAQLLGFLRLLVAVELAWM